MNKFLILLLSLLASSMPYSIHESGADEGSVDQSLEFEADPVQADPTSRFLSTDNLSNNAGFSTTQKIAISGSNVYVVWTDDTLGNNEIFFRVSYDKGANFEDEINLSNNAGGSAFPQVAISGSNVYVVWEDTTLGNADVFFTRSTDNGATFGNAINLSNNAGGSFSPQIAVSGSKVYVVWEDPALGNFDIFFRATW
jgi:hypothetical protein